MKKYKGYRFPIEIISYAVWCYYRLSISLRDVEALLLKRGIEVSYETIGQWVKLFGTAYARKLRRKQVKFGDKWHVDEQCIIIKGQKYWLWRAQYGQEIDILVQSRRNAKAAIRFFKKLLKGVQQIPRVMVTDKLRSYKAAKRKILKKVEHRAHKGINNIIETAHQSTRLRKSKCEGTNLPLKHSSFYPYMV